MKTEREKMYEVFKAAKRYLCLPNEIEDWGHKEQYICSAINCVTDMHPRISERACRWARHEIHRRIAPHYSLPTWLFHNGVSKEELNWRTIQAHRHQWLDLLIEEYAE